MVCIPQPDINGNEVAWQKTGARTEKLQPNGGASVNEKGAQTRAKVFPDLLL